MKKVLILILFALVANTNVTFASEIGSNNAQLDNPHQASCLCKKLGTLSETCEIPFGNFTGYFDTSAQTRNKIDLGNQLCPQLCQNNTGYTYTPNNVLPQFLGDNPCAILENSHANEEKHDDQSENEYESSVNSVSSNDDDDLFGFNDN